MDVYEKILKNGDLLISILFDDEDERANLLRYGLFNRENYILDYLKDDNFRLIHDTEKIEIGDLTDAPIFTDIEADLDGDWNERSWVYAQYMTMDWTKDLLINREITLKARKNI
jgi:hypothetical protein